MKSVPPPLPKRFPIVERPAPMQTPINQDSNQTAFMIGGLVVLILLILGLLILIASLMKKVDSGETQDAGSGGEAGIIGEEHVGAARDEARKDKEASQPTDSSATEPNTQSSPRESAAETVATPATQSTKQEDVPPEPESESGESTSTATEAELEELPKGARVIPLFSEPSAVSAPTLEASNPFLDVGKANTIVFVIDKSSSMSDRLGRVIKALNQAIEKLHPDQSFQLIFFDDVPRLNPNTSGLLKATKRHKEAMAEWIKNYVSASGGTYPLDAVKMAIDLKPDRVVILSDGEFNPDNVESITHYNSTNRQKGIRIDCIGLDEVVESLQQIAKQNGPGIYYQAR